jgi:peptidoglycan/xylan/chitin deacetylase (PgdA/CDA1 family)
VEKCQKLTKSKLFRPPYARGTRAQYAQLKHSHEIIMWDVMSGDFDISLSPEQCLANVVKHASNGSIIVFHDNIKAKSRVLYTLPRAIEEWKKQGFQFKTL